MVDTEVHRLNEEAPDRPLPPIVVPFTELSPDALAGVIESYVLREGTDYGERDVSLETKVMQVRRQLERHRLPLQGKIVEPDTHGA